MHQIRTILNDLAARSHPNGPQGFPGALGHPQPCDRAASLTIALHDHWHQPCTLVSLGTTPSGTTMAGMVHLRPQVISLGRQALGAILEGQAQPVSIGLRSPSRITLLEGFVRPPGRWLQVEDSPIWYAPAWEWQIKAYEKNYGC